MNNIKLIFSLDISERQLIYFTKYNLFKSLHDIFMSFEEYRLYLNAFLQYPDWT